MSSRGGSRRSRRHHRFLLAMLALLALLPLAGVLPVAAGAPAVGAEATPTAMPVPDFTMPLTPPTLAGTPDVCAFILVLPADGSIDPGIVVPGVPPFRRAQPTPEPVPTPPASGTLRQLPQDNAACHPIPPAVWIDGDAAAGR